VHNLYFHGYWIFKNYISELPINLVYLCYLFKCGMWAIKVLLYCFTSPFWVCSSAVWFCWGWPGSVLGWTREGWGAHWFDAGVSQELKGLLEVVYCPLYIYPTPVVELFRRCCQKLLLIISALFAPNLLKAISTTELQREQVVRLILLCWWLSCWISPASEKIFQSRNSVYTHSCIGVNVKDLIFE
jgi:hypothetical protein